MKDPPALRRSRARDGTLQEDLLWPDNPVLVEAWRSGFLESVHRGALVVLGIDGSPLFTAGEVERPILPRSSNKPVQARSEEHTSELQSRQYLVCRLLL